MKKLILSILLCFVPVVCFAQDAEKQASIEDIEQNIRKRALEYYEALNSKDFDKLYDMESQVVREMITKESYIESAESNVEESAQEVGPIARIKLPESRVAEVYVFLDATDNGEKKRVEYKDLWIYENDNWYHTVN